MCLSDRDLNVEVEHARGAGRVVLGGHGHPAVLRQHAAAVKPCRPVGGEVGEGTRHLELLINHLRGERFIINVFIYCVPNFYTNKLFNKCISCK